MAKDKDIDLDIKVLGGSEIPDDSPSTHPEIPDGGWGWFVCAGTFIVNFIVFGIHNSFGVVYANLLDELNMGKAETGKFFLSISGMDVKNPTGENKPNMLGFRNVRKMSTEYHEILLCIEKPEI